MKKVIYLILFSIIFFSCKEESKYFNGKVININYKIEADSLFGKQVRINGVIAGGIEIYDTLAIFISKFPDYYMNVYNINSGDFLYPLCRRGQGEHEFINITWASQFEIKDSLCLWVREYGRNKCYLLNVQQPNNPFVETIDITEYNKFPYGFGFLFVLNDGLFLGHTQAEDAEVSGNFIPPKYHLYNYVTKEKKETFSFYNSFATHEKLPVQNYLHSRDKIKPDKTKLAMGMELIDQINIFDIKSGQIKGFRNNSSPNFDYLRQSQKNFRRYYSRIVVDDDFIYGLYSNTPYLDFKFNSSTINVFDWDGNFIKSLVLDHETMNIALDPKNKLLYSIVDGDEESELFCYDVGYLYKKM